MNTRADDSRAEGVCEGRVKPRQDAAAVQVAGGGGLKRKKSGTMELEMLRQILKSLQRNN